MKNLNSFSISPNLLILLATMAYWALFMTMPRTHDDYWYLRGLEEYGQMTDGSFDFIKGVIGTAIDHHNNDNSRIPNILGTLIVSLPLWLLALISALSVYFTFYFSKMLSQSKSYFGTTVIVMLYTFVVPWNNSLFSGMFTYNYIWTGGIMTFAIVMFLQEHSISWGWMFSLGIILGAWHEIYSFPTLIGALSCFLLHKNMIRRDRLWFCVGLLIGCAWLWLSPSRTSQYGYGSYIVFHRQWREMIDVYWLPFLFLAIELLCLVYNKWKKDALNPIIIFAVSFSIICLPVYIFSAAPRAYTPAIIMSAIGIVYLLRNSNISTSHWCMWACIAIWLFFFVHMGMAFKTGLDIRREENFIISEYKKAKDKDGVVFADVTTPDKTPWITLNKPFQRLYTYYSHSALVGKYFHGPWMKVIPTVLRDFTEEKGKIVNSNIKIWEYEGNLVAEDFPVDLTKPVAKARFEYADGKIIGFALSYPFTTSSGKKYVYLSAPTKGIASVKINLNGD